MRPAFANWSSPRWVWIRTPSNFASRVHRHHVELRGGGALAAGLARHCTRTTPKHVVAVRSRLDDRESDVADVVRRGRFSEIVEVHLTR